MINLSFFQPRWNIIFYCNQILFATTFSRLHVIAPFFVSGPASFDGYSQRLVGEGFKLILADHETYGSRIEARQPLCYRG